MKNFTMKTLALVAAGLLAAGAPADYLHWMVDSTVRSYFDWGKTIDFSYAKVWYGQYDYSTQTKGSTGVYLTAYEGTTNVGTEMDAGADSGIQGAAAYSWFDYTSGYSFVYELYAEGGEMLGYLAQEYSWWPNAIVSSQGGADGAYVLQGIIPEPSSGLLSLVGFGVLALRRKKRA